MMKFLFISSLILFLSGCFVEEETVLDENILSDYISINQNRQLDDLIACAAGQPVGFPSSDNLPTAVFFYPITGATDFRYFEAEDVADSLVFSKYIRKSLTDEPVFNGYLWKFNNTAFDGERMGIVTYITDEKLHICTPIRMKTYTQPTELNNELLIIEENGINPSFTWQDGTIDENVIYFQVISDSLGNLVSGTYTYEKDFAFYDLENVVLNISTTDPLPTLNSESKYQFTMMAVSEDNWVNLLIQEDFQTK